MANANQWKCVVCGYIHDGPSPPEVCPVCGAPASEFEPYGGPPDTVIPAAGSVRRWRCIVCNYECEGAAPPDECPVCGAGRESFEPAGEEQGAGGHAASFHALVVGAGIAGLAATEALLRYAPGCGITLVSAEDDLPYYRLNLTRYLAGEVPEPSLVIHPAEWYSEHNVQLLRGVEIRSLDPRGRTATMSNGAAQPFDRLVLAAGAAAAMPPFPGNDLHGVTRLRSLADARAIVAALRPGMPVVVIGGGILGLEAAAAMARRGAQVTIVEMGEYLMPRQLNPRAGAMLASFLDGMGIRLCSRAQVERIAGDTAVSAVLLKDGTKLPASLVVVSAGIRPSVSAAREAGLDVAGGIVVDDRLATSAPDVYAAGDVAEHRGVIYGLWGPAQYQGTIAGMNAAGTPAEFKGIPRSNTVKVLGIDLFSAGDFAGSGGGCTFIEQEADGHYYLFVEKAGVLVGSILFGDAAAASAVKKAIEDRRPLAELLKAGPSARQLAGALIR